MQRSQPQCLQFNRRSPTVNSQTFVPPELYTFYELVQLCLYACNYYPHLNELSRLVWRSPSEAQHGSFQSYIFQPCHFTQKNVLLPCSSAKCHAILCCVGRIASMAVVKEPRPSKPTGGWAFWKMGEQTMHLVLFYFDLFMKMERRDCKASLLSIFWLHIFSILLIL